MRVYIKDNTTGQEINVTDLVADCMGVETIEQDNAEAIDIAADYARGEFGHNDIDAYSK